MMIRECGLPREQTVEASKWGKKYRSPFQRGALSGAVCGTASLNSNSNKALNKADLRAITILENLRTRAGASTITRLVFGIPKPRASLSLAHCSGVALAS